MGGGGENMSRKPYSWLVVVGMISLCIGLSGCGKNADTVAGSSIPIEPGEHVMYGSYQGEPVEWRVLDKKDGEILLLSEYGLDILPFDDSGSGSIIWENSSIRNWLNNEFYNSTFSKEEQENILVSSSEGFDENNESVSWQSEKPYWHLERKTEDKVFLLSYTEMVEYLIINSGLEFYDHQYAYDELLCYPTEYAKQQLYQVFDIDTCGWWLCNPEYSECVENDDFKTYSEMITAYGQLDLAKMDSIQNAVRPAMWVTWQSDMETIEEE